MRYELLQRAQWMHLRFGKGGGFPCNLLGGDLAAEVAEDGVCFEINMSKNLRVQNKSVNSFGDAKRFAEDPTFLESVQMNDMRIARRLGEICQSHDRRLKLLRIRLDSYGSVSYPVVARLNGGLGLLFEVQSQGPERLG